MGTFFFLCADGLLELEAGTFNKTLEQKITAKASSGWADDLFASFEEEDDDDDDNDEEKQLKQHQWLYQNVIFHQPISSVDYVKYLLIAHLKNFRLKILYSESSDFLSLIGIFRI